MGIIKLILILFTILIVGFTGGMFMVRNDMEIPVQILISASPLHLTVGKLSAYSFFLGITIGVLLCVAYIFVQFIELQASRRKIANYEKQVEALRSTSFKDAP